MPNNYFIDLHCHPAMKPYGQSFDSDFPKQNELNANRKRSVWHYDKDGLLERKLSEVGGFPPFTQSDFSTLAYAKATVIGISLYPLEKRFVQIYNTTEKKWKSPVDRRDILLDGITGISKARINYVQQMQNYFQDLKDEYAYYTSLENKIVNLSGTKATYKIARNYTDIQTNLTLNENRKSTDPLIITLFITIEGTHVFNAATYVDAPASISAIKAMIKEVKEWNTPPFFITYCHHYFNGLCGHSRSLNGMIAGKAPQEEGINESFNDKGKQVLELLLSRDNGKRIYIDIKHMSPLARIDYYAHINSMTGVNKVPIIVSHGAVNGLASYTDQRKLNWPLKPVFLDWPINFYDDEIILLAQSGGLFGIQLDERRVASVTAIKESRGFLQSRATIRRNRSGFLWNQIAYMAELLDGKGLFAWNIQSIGSDNDGIINPINGFETAEDYEALELCLIEYANIYMNGDGKNKLTMAGNKSISGEEIINRFMRTNAHDFLSRWFW